MKPIAAIFLGNCATLIVADLQSQPPAITGSERIKRDVEGRQWYSQFMSMRLPKEIYREGC